MKIIIAIIASIATATPIGLSTESNIVDLHQQLDTNEIPIEATTETELNDDELAEFINGLDELDAEFMALMDELSEDELEELFNELNDEIERLDTIIAEERAAEEESQI